MWDVRSGKAVAGWSAHMGQSLAADWAPNGVHLATAGDDRLVHIWDLRKQETVYSIPAHSRLISCVKWAPSTGEYLLTSAYDGSIRAWAGRDWTPLATLAAHEDKVTAVDVAGDGDLRIASTGFDRTLKVWDIQPA